MSELLEGTDTASYRYDPYGAMTQEEPIHDRLFGFNGEEYTPQTGLQYLRARHYAPEDGRFTTQDSYLGTLTNTASQNRYAYCENDPVNYIDPSGYARSNPNTSNALSDKVAAAFGLDAKTGLPSYSPRKSGAVFVIEVVDGVMQVSVLLPVPNRYNYDKNPNAKNLLYTYNDKEYFKVPLVSVPVPKSIPNSTNYIETNINIGTKLTNTLVNEALKANEDESRYKGGNSIYTTNDKDLAKAIGDSVWAQQQWEEEEWPEWVQTKESGVLINLSAIIPSLTLTLGVSYDRDGTQKFTPGVTVGAGLKGLGVAIYDTFTTCPFDVWVDSNTIKTYVGISAIFGAFAAGASGSDGKSYQGVMFTFGTTIGMGGESDVWWKMDINKE